MIATNIAHIVSRLVFSSHFKLCLETDVVLNSGAFGRSNLRIPESFVKSFDLDKIHQINGSLLGQDASIQAEIDAKIEKLAEFFLLPLSVACARAIASHHNISFYRYLSNAEPYVIPVPFMHALNNRKKTNLIKDIFIVPVNFNSFKEAFDAGRKILHNLKNCSFSGNEKDLLAKIHDGIKKSGYLIGKDIFLALELEILKYQNNRYQLRKDVSLSSYELIDYIADFICDAGIISLNNTIASSDKEAAAMFMNKLGTKSQIVAKKQDLTNNQELASIAHTVSISNNNFSSLTGMFNLMLEAEKNLFSCLLKYQPDGQIEDTFMADVAVATGIGQVSFGSSKYISSMSQYNQILRIEEELNSNQMIYPQLKAFNLEI